jgi:hypothetical protein
MDWLTGRPPRSITDVGEERDVAAQHPEIIRQIAAIMTSARIPSEHWPWSEQHL